jgi:peptidoglycan/LPS O-acetylase OafA/YrhL
MADMRAQIESNGLRWRWAALVAVAACIAVAACTAILVDAAYSDFVDGHPLWGVVCVVLGVLPLVVAFASHPSPSQAGAFTWVAGLGQCQGFSFV